MKKLLSLVLVLAMVLSMVVFSNSSAEEAVKLTFSSWGDAAEKAILEKALAAFTADTGIEVEYLYTPDDYITKLTTMAAANELPDVGYLSEPNVVQWANEGMLKDISDVLESGNVEDKMDIAKFVNKDGEVVGVSVAVETIVIFYNPTYFDAMGVAYPPSTADTAWTWDQFVDVCRQLTVDQNGKHPGEDGFDANNIKTYGVKLDDAQYVYEPLVRSNNGGIFTNDGTAIGLADDATVEVFQAIADLINVEHVAPSAGDATSSMDISSCFLSNSCAMVISGQWSIQSLAISAEEDGITYDVGVLPYFKKPVTVNTGTPIVVFRDTQHEAEAKLLASYILNTEFVMDFIKSGLWQPVSENWYTDEALISQWLTEGVHPAHYREAIINYCLQCTEQNSYFTIGCTSQIEDLYLAALDNVLLGTTTAKDAMNSIIDEANKVMSDYLVSVGK